MQRNESRLEKHITSRKNRRVLSKTDSPFVCQNKPFVGSRTPYIRPFICKNIPFVRVNANLRSQLGVTLIELMITLAIFAIIGAFAMPSFQQMLLNNTTTARANEFLVDLNYARSEALKRGMTVEVCIPDAAQTNCDYGATWSGAAGRVIGVRNPAVPGVLDIIRVRGPLSAIRSLGVPLGISYTSVSFFNSGLVQFRSGGGTIEINRAQVAVFGLCHDSNSDGVIDASDAPKGRNIRIGPTGSIKVSSPATTCAP